MLHLEIITERLNREFNLELIVTMPSITYKVILRNGKEEIIYSPHLFPDDSSIVKVLEPWVVVKIIAPSIYLSSLMPYLFEHEAIVGATENFGDNRSSIDLEMPLRELMRNFFDDMKSLTSGYASIAYEQAEMRDADVVRMDVLVGDEVIPAFTRVISRRRIQEEAERFVDLLEKLLPRQMVVMKVQAKCMGRIIASRTLKAFRKDVTGYLYGGDISRKMKLLQKQKKGKKKMAEHAKVQIPHDVFLKVMRNTKND
jgi:GTP-binding protein LepA